MRLDDFLKETGMTETDFGVRVGISQSQVNRLRNGKAGTTWDTALRIVRESNGQVTLPELGFAQEAAQ